VPDAPADMAWSWSSGVVRSVDTRSFEKAVEQLSPEELARFRAWFEAFDAQLFDAAVERDAQAGKVDALADEALAAYRTGRSKQL
jgi:hypothetical protein